MRDTDDHIHRSRVQQMIEIIVRQADGVWAFNAALMAE